MYNSDSLVLGAVLRLFGALPRLFGALPRLLCHIPRVPRDNRTPCQVAFQICPVTRVPLGKMIQKTRDETCPAFFLPFIDTGSGRVGCLSRNGQCWEETRPAGVLSLLDGGSADTAGRSNLETQPASTSPDIFLAEENAQRRKVIRMQPLQLCIFSG